jgi:hypothetical protein
LGIGIVATLWAGLGVTIAAQNAFNRVYAIPHYEQPDFLTSRWRGLRVLAVAGVLQVISTVAAGLVSGGVGGSWLTVAGIVFSLLVNLLLFTAVFRFLIPRTVPLAELWPGIVLAAVGWEVLQTVGGLYVAHVIKGANQTYGTFATVIGLMAWLYLGARIVVYAAQINVVLTRGLWPRSLMDPPEPADRRARATLAKMEERDRRETVEVAFHPPDEDKRPELHRPPYAVAPEPAPGEAAIPLAPQIATADLHTLTLAQVLDAVEDCLDEVHATAEAKREARERLRAARDRLLAEDRDDRADRALAQAARRALGLAGIS